MKGPLRIGAVVVAAVLAVAWVGNAHADRYWALLTEVLAAARAKREDPFFSDHERHEFEEKLVVEILTQFHPNLSTLRGTWAR